MDYTDPMTDTQDFNNQEIIVNRVERGVSWLDAHVPDWIDKVEVIELQMADPCRCILGQVFGDEADPEPYGYSGFDIGLDKAYETDPDGLDESATGWAVDHGFDADIDWEYSALAEEWSGVIEARRKAKV